MLDWLNRNTIIQPESHWIVIVTRLELVVVDSIVDCRITTLSWNSYVISNRSNRTVRIRVYKTFFNQYLTNFNMDASFQGTCTHLLLQTEFDEYVDYLLSTKPTQSGVLRDQIDDLYEKRVSNPKQLRHVRRDLNQLEEEGRDLLEKNDILREELRREKEAVTHGIPTGKSK